MYRKNKAIQAVLAAMIVILAFGIFEGNGKAVSAAPQSRKAGITRQARQYVVDPNGTGDFVTIQEGVDNASDGDTLLLYPGIYTEQVQVMSKDINIVGINKDLCILECDTRSYRAAPLTMAAGTVSNLTIYGMNTNAVQEELTDEEIAQINAQLVGDSWDRQKNYAGYAVHIDQNFMYGRSIHFENCRIISENNHCVGIGSRGKSTISFENCELVSLGGGSCIFMHDPTSAAVSGEAHLVMKSCYMTSYLCPYVMTFHSLMPEHNTMKLTFQNTHISAIAFADDTSYVPVNINNGFDVETLIQLQKMNNLQMTGLQIAGLNTPLAELVHETTPEEARDYIEAVETALNIKTFMPPVMPKLADGITYLEVPTANVTSLVKHQVIALYNNNNLPGNGWCGLDNAVLTADSYGNTLPEMNAAVINTPDMVNDVSAVSPVVGY